MESNGLLLFVLIAFDAFLWIGGTVFSMSGTNRFRVYSTAYLVLVVILAMLLGWQTGTIVAFVGLWIAAIIWNGINPMADAA